MFIFVVFFTLRLIKFAIYRTHRFDESKKYALFSLARYAIIALGTTIGLQILGVNLSVLMAGSAALLVGLGLGLQHLFSDFVSGIILLADATIKVNDIIEVNGIVCKVRSVNLRTTLVLTRDEKYIVLPNTEITRNRIINWTYQAVASRFEITIGVDYSSDVDLVTRLLLRCASANSDVLREPKPFVRFEDYGESALVFKLFFFTEEVFRVGDVESAIRRHIWQEFQEHAVTVPFPQRVLHNAPRGRVQPTRVKQQRKS
ncbi:MAG: mechanosensitive ion channel [Turneriella sp.]|nr:mechanosensitive ion channel [Turneriella sp.]